MVLYGLEADPQLLCDLGVAPSVGNQCQHLGLSSGQVDRPATTTAGEQPFGRAWTEHGTAGSNGANRGEDFLLTRALEHVAVGTYLESGGDAVVVVDHRQHQNCG